MWLSWLQRLQSSPPSGSEPIPHILRANCRSVPWRESGRDGLSHSCLPGESQRLPPWPQRPQQCCRGGGLQPDPRQQLGSQNLKPIRFALMHLIPKPKLLQGPTHQLREWNPTTACAPHNAETPGTAPQPAVREEEPRLEQRESHL